MIKTNKLNKFNTSFAQNILSKYGIGRWKGQFSRLIFRNRSDMVFESGEGEEPFNYTEVKKYNTLLKIYKYINSNSKIIIPGTKQTVTLKPSYIKTDNIINIITPTEIRLNTKTELAKLIQKVIFNTNNQEQKYFFHSQSEKQGSEISGYTNKTHKDDLKVKSGAANYTNNQEQKYFFHSQSEKQGSEISGYTNKTYNDDSKAKSKDPYNNKYVYNIANIENKENIIYNKANTKLFDTERVIKEKEAREHTYQHILEKEITYKEEHDKSTVVQQNLYKSELSDNIYVQLKQSKLILNTFNDVNSLTVSSSGIFKNRVIHEVGIVNKNSIINKNSNINKLQSAEKLGHPQNRDLQRKPMFDEVHSFSEYDMFYSTQKQNVKHNILRDNEFKEIESDEYEKFVHFLPQKNNSSTNLVFYRPQLKDKEQKEQEKKEILPMDVMHAEKSVYAKAASASKTDKKHQSMGTEEVNMLADRVFQILEKRLAIQKDRRGLR